ncbi:MAG: four helix bundle protein [Sphingobacteriales bacterium]|nr:MAG: four helix bundle protein [Sphingobacteriales bacterium]
MATFNRKEDIEAWQLARQLCQEVQAVCVRTELRKDVNLRDQISASSGSVMDNIAEGFGRGGNREFFQFLEIAHASCLETQSQLYRVLDKCYIDEAWFERVYRLSKRTSGAIVGLIRYLQLCEIRGPRFKIGSPNPKPPKP